jgi:hypothetical protein
MRKILYILVLCSFFLIKMMGNEPENRYMKIVNLGGKWKLMIGDNPKWKDPGFDDSDWESVKVPSNWENEGFYGYDGFAWYRKTFTLPAGFEKSTLMLFLGYIDDVDAAYINGHEIGHMGSFPPDYWTAYNSERRYKIPNELLIFGGQNTIAIRVYDSQLDGGIVGGDVGVYQRFSDLEPDVDLEGYWKFSLGDDLARAKPFYDDSQWTQIAVPGIWEDQVTRNYDGFGWYRKQFKVKASMRGKRYVFMLGKIDDLDEVYINGKMVGKTGEIYNNPSRIHLGNEYAKPRYYYLNEEDLVPGEINTIAIRVFDGGGEGGIYRGPVGLVELRKFVNYWRSR